MKDGGSTTSLWIDTTGPLEAPGPRTPLPSDVDVCVIGAGIAGLAIAFELARKGTRVLVLDDGPLGGGETGRTSAHLSSALDDRFHHLESMFGDARTRLAAESHAAAIDWIEAMVRELHIDCDFQRVDGYLFSPPGENRDGELLKELVAARRAGLQVDVVPRPPLPVYGVHGVTLRFAEQAEFHPLAFLQALANAAAERGALIYTGVHVTGIEDDMPVRVTLSDGRVVRCLNAVDATNGAFTSRMKLHLRMAAYRSYVLGFDVPGGAIPHGLYWDLADSYHYIRVARGTAPGREVLLVGGSDHRVGQGNPAQSLDELEAWVREHLPIAGQVISRWSGQVLEPADSLALIGKHPSLDHVYLVTGDSGHGLTHGVIAGMLIPELIAGRRPAWADLYDPARRRHAYGSLAKEAAQSAAPYFDWFRKSDVPSVDDIPRGEGAVMRRGLHLVATYRDEAGAVHECSAVCPHLKAVVRWNDVEKTWDCPCHGSRFDPRGRVLNGPAAADLAPLDGIEAPTPIAEQPPRVTERNPVMQAHPPAKS